MTDTDNSNMPSQSELHHVGIIVPNRERVDELLPLMGLTERQAVHTPEYEAWCIFAGGERGLIEFIVPDPGSKLADFNGGMGGIHHVALEVQDLRATMRSLSEAGVEFLEPEPVQAGNLLVNFVPPLATRGIIIEYVQRVDGALD